MDKEFAEAFKEEIEKEASTYTDKARDDEKKKKRHFAFGGKKDKTRHGSGGYGTGHKEEVDREFAEAFKEEIEERKMTDDEMAEREEIVKKMKPKLQSFKDRYGDDAKKVMYATATKQAMEEFKIDEGWKKGKYKVTDGKTGKVLGTFNSGAKAQKYVDDIFQKGDYESLTVELDEEVEIEEKKSATGYELYHKTFSDAMQHAYAHAKSKGFVVDPKEIDDKVATGPKKPSSGKTNRYSLKAGRKKVEIQVANLDNKRYELNMYIEGVVLESTKEYAKSLEKIARDKQMSMISKSDKEKLLKIAELLAKERKEGVELDEDQGDEEHRELVQFKARWLMKQALKSGKKQNQAWWNKQARIAGFERGADAVKVLTTILDTQKEDVELDEAEIATSIGSGGTAGLDMGLTYKKKKEDVKKAKALRKQMVGESVQRTTFAGKDVFIVDSETYYNCRLGKKKYGRYEKYVGNGKVGQTIREYGLKYPRRPIILQNGESGPMLFLKYGRS